MQSHQDVEAFLCAVCNHIFAGVMWHLDMADQGSLHMYRPAVGSGRQQLDLAVPGSKICPLVKVKSPRYGMRKRKLVWNRQLHTLQGKLWHLDRNDPGSLQMYWPSRIRSPTAWSGSSTQPNLSYGQGKVTKMWKQFCVQCAITFFAGVMWHLDMDYQGSIQMYWPAVGSGSSRQPNMSFGLGKVTEMWSMEK